MCQPTAASKLTQERLHVTLKWCIKGPKEIRGRHCFQRTLLPISTNLSSFRTEVAFEVALLLVDEPYVVRQRELGLKLLAADVAFVLLEQFRLQVILQQHNFGRY